MRRPVILYPMLFLLLICAPLLAQPRRASLSSTLNYDALHPNQQAVIAVTLDVKQGLHAQSHTPLNDKLIAFTVDVEPNPQVQFFPPIYPEETIETYAELGRVSVYTGKVTVYVPIQVKSAAPDGPITIKGQVHYQICDEKACFLPEHPAFELQTKIVPVSASVNPVAPELFKDFDPSVFSTLLPVGATFTLFGHNFSANSYWIIYGAALLVGIIFNVMPCVLPVLPLKALGFYEASRHHRGRSFALGLFFSGGIISTFAALAVLVLFFGQNWGQLFSYGWFVWTITAILILFAMSMFGFYTFRVPLGVYSFEPRHDTYSGNFLFGILAAILSTPCTAPVFPALLAWAAAQPRALGVGMMLMVGVGMALPYLILSAFPELARRIPRTGQWSELIKQFMGFIILGVAAYFAGLRLFVGHGYLWMMLVVSIAAGVFLLVRTIRIAPRAWPIAIAACVSIAMIGGTLYGAVRANREGLWTDYTVDNFAIARKSGRIVLLDFTANWCLNCQYIEGTVYPDPRTLAALKQYDVIMLKADLTLSDAPGWPLLKQLSPSGGIPLTVIWAPGKDQPIELASIYTTDALLEALSNAKSSAVVASTDHKEPIDAPRTITPLSVEKRPADSQRPAAANAPSDQSPAPTSRPTLDVSRELFRPGFAR